MVNNIVVVKNTKKDLGTLEFKKLKEYISKDLNNKFISKSKIFLTNFYESEFASDVLLSRAKIFMSRGEYQKASSDLIFLYTAYPNSKLKDQALFENAICLYKMDDKNGSISLLEKIDLANLSEQVCEKVLWMLANLYKDSSLLYDAVNTFIKLHSFSNNEEIKNNAFISLNTILTDLSLDELDRLYSKKLNKSVEPYVLFEYGEKLIKNAKMKDARKIFIELISKFPEHEYQIQSENYLQKLENLDKVDGNTIGVILPLSGKDKVFGQRSLRGIQMAAGFFSSEKENELLTDINQPIRIAIIDSQSDPDIARLKVDKLISEDHVVGIIGSLRSDTAESVSKACALVGVPNITLSHKEGLSQISDYIFSITMNKENQIKKLVDYVYDQQNIRKFAILYPDDGFGKDYMQVFWDAVLVKGGKITAVQKYEPKQVDFKSEFKALSSLSDLSVRTAEYEELKALRTAELGRDPRADELKLSPLIDFEAIFIPDDAKAVGQIAPYFAFFDIENVSILGPNVLNSIQLIKRGKEYVEGAIFVDDFFINNIEPTSIEFINNFRTVYGTDPGVLEAESFDATKILISALKKLNLKKEATKSIAREDLKEELLNTKSFKGATGAIEFNENGKSVKSLFVLGVENGKIIQKN